MGVHYVWRALPPGFRKSARERSDMRQHSVRGDPFLRTRVDELDADAAGRGPGFGQRGGTSPGADGHLMIKSGECRGERQDSCCRVARIVVADGIRLLAHMLCDQCDLHRSWLPSAG